MATASPLSRPPTPLYRVLEAVGSVTAEIQTIGSIVGRPLPVETAGAAHTREFLVRSTQRVIDHYRQILANRQMSEVERNNLQARLAEQERLLRGLFAEQKQRSSGRRFLGAA